MPMLHALRLKNNWLKRNQGACLDSSQDRSQASYIIYHMRVYFPCAVTTALHVNDFNPHDVYAMQAQRQ